MKILKRLKVLLWLPFVVLYFPLLVVIGGEKTDSLGEWIVFDLD